ncbi:hypothetical protein VTN00DRAFT_2294 [Thermoascus crustaceus]|uniref:uncharacterized protein n=1 Tax=Thermoascus crustaceus TaxID=5088 RepID=UPI0037434672
MTPSSSPLASSSLGETCALYLDFVATKLPFSLRPLTNRFAAALSSSSTSLQPSLRPFSRFFLDSEQPFVPSFATTFVLTVLACLLVVAVMSWRQPFDRLWRLSPYSSAPQVNDSDYSYITSEDIVDEASPDILLLKHRGVTYPLHFPAYAIDDGALTVGELRQRAAEKMGTSDPQRIRLLYKRKLLDDDSLPCKAEGLKQQSEVVCVVSEVQPGESTPSEISGSDGERTSDSTRSHVGKSGKKRNRNKKPKDRQTDPSSLAPPVDSKRPPSSGRSSVPPPAPNLQQFRAPQEQVDALAHYFRTELLPFCNDYIAKPPTDTHAREFEHRKLSETVLQQVILKADGIEPDGDSDARIARKALIKEVQGVLTKLDQAAKE